MNVDRTPSSNAGQPEGAPPAHLPVPERSFAIPEETEQEIRVFEAETQRFMSGDLAPERYRSFRLGHGIYGQRQPGVQMVRVKIPGGQLDGRQIRRLAAIAETYGHGIAHVTTRQDVQFHYVPMERVGTVMRELAEVGLTTREACGNSVRNVTACPLSGHLADEAFDVHPYARALSGYLLRNAFCQQLARKFKIAFSSCPEDCAATGIHDIGAAGVVVERGGRSRYGFRIVAGGGLGASPMAAAVVEEFVPVERLLPVSRAILEVFSAHGNRKSKGRARLKFVVHKLGAERFRELVREAEAKLTPEQLQEADLLRWVPEASLALVVGHLAGVPSLVEIRTAQALAAVRPAVWAALAAVSSPESTRRIGAGPGKGLPTTCNGGASEAAFLQWQTGSVRPHRNPSHVIVTVLLPLGDASAPALRALGHLVTRFGEDRARAGQNQDVVLPTVRREDLRPLWDGLAAAGLAEPGAGSALDVTACPGADTCAIGITSSKGLARAVRNELASFAEVAGIDPLRGASIRMSGCPNSCGWHHVASVGLHGVVQTIGGRQIPSYQLHLGGRIAPGEARFGVLSEKVPAKHAPGVIRALFAEWLKERETGEPLEEFLARIPRERVRELIAVERHDAANDLAVDWGQTEAFSTTEIGTGECAGSGVDPTVDPFGGVEAELAQARIFLDAAQGADALATLNRSQYSLARVLLERLGVSPESDEETTGELRARVIDRGFAGEEWNALHDELEGLLRTRTPAGARLEEAHAAVRGVLEAWRGLPARLEALRQNGHNGHGGEVPA